MKKLFLTALIVSIFALLGSVGFGCGESSPVAPGNSEIITDIYDKGGCILLEITMKNGIKFSYWVTSYYKEDELLHLFNQHGFLISIDCTQIQDITETNNCNTK